MRTIDLKNINVVNRLEEAKQHLNDIAPHHRLFEAEQDAIG